MTVDHAEYLTSILPVDCINAAANCVSVCETSCLPDGDNFFLRLHYFLSSLSKVCVGVLLSTVNGIIRP